MKYDYRHHHLIYFAAFGLLGFTITSTVKSANEEPKQMLELAPIVNEVSATQAEDLEFIKVVDVDPMDPAAPTHTSVGSTLKATWNLDIDASLRLSVSENDGEDWRILVSSKSSSGSHVWTLEETDATSLLVKIEGDGNHLLSERITLQ